MKRVRILVEGDVDDSADDGVVDAVVLGGRPDEYGLSNPTVVAYETGGVWERDALVGALRSIADKLHTGDAGNILDWDEQCPAHGPARYAQAVLEALGLQFVRPEPWREGGQVRADPDDGRRWTYDPARDHGDPTPWRVDDDRPPNWVSRADLPTEIVPAS